MKILSRHALLPLAALLALGGCESMPAGSRAVATNQPVVTSVPATTTTSTTVTSTPTAALVNSPYPGSLAPPSSSTTTVTTIVSAPARLTQNETLTLMTENTAAGLATNGRLYFSHYRRDGQMAFRQDAFKDWGSWRVLADGQLCQMLPKVNSGFEECYSLYREGTNIRFDRPDGNKVGSFTVELGNPQNI